MKSNKSKTMHKASIIVVSILLIGSGLVYYGIRNSEEAEDKSINNTPIKVQVKEAEITSEKQSFADLCGGSSRCNPYDY